MGDKNKRDDFNISFTLPAEEEFNSKLQKWNRPLGALNLVFGFVLASMTGSVGGLALFNLYGWLCMFWGAYNIMDPTYRLFRG